MNFVTHINLMNDETHVTNYDCETDMAALRLMAIHHIHNTITGSCVITSGITIRDRYRIETNTILNLVYTYVDSTADRSARRTNT